MCLVSLLMPNATALCIVACCKLQVMQCTLDNEAKCEELKRQYLRFDYLWKNDLQKALHDFIAAEGVVGAGGAKDDPPLAKFEEQVNKYK